MNKIPNLSELEQVLNYQFNHKHLLIQALTHRSFSAANNERLEFIGDAILNYSVAYMLFITFRELQEGDLSKIRASLVNQETLAEIARQIGLGQYLRLGPGELKTAGYDRSSILSDAMEAIFAAISLDSDFGTAQRIIQSFYQARIKQFNPEQIKDAKSTLQEILQARKIALPEYRILTQTGEAHQQLFEVECAIHELSINTKANGSSRKKAEQKAAALALSKIQQL